MYRKHYRLITEVFTPPSSDYGICRLHLLRITLIESSQTKVAIELVCLGTFLSTTNPDGSRLCYREHQSSAVESVFRFAQAPSERTPKQRKHASVARKANPALIVSKSC